MTFPGWLLLILMALVAMAPEAVAQSADAATIRDSAGIRIVENVRPAIDSARAWRLDPAPAVTIGGSVGDSLYQFADLFVVGRLSNGEIVTADAKGRRVSYYSTDGRFARSIGRAGQGPNEFPRPFHSAWLCGDSVMVRLIDYNDRIVVVSPVPAFTRIIERFTRPQGRRAFLPLACGHGRFVWAVSRLSPSAPVEPGMRIAQADFGIVTHDGRWLGFIDGLSGEAYSTRVAGEPGLVGVPAPFGRKFSSAVSARGVYATSTRDYEITRYTLEGVPSMIVRVRHEPRRITGADRERALASALETSVTERTRAAYRAAFAERSLPNSLPAIAELLVDAADNLWVREYDDGDMLADDLSTTTPRAPGPDHQRRWAVFAPDGRLLTRVVTPPRFTVTQIGTDWIIGVHYDVDDVASVRLYRVRK